MVHPVYINCTFIYKHILLYIHAVFVVCSILKTWNDYRSEYLSVESWQEWWYEMVETVRTARRSANTQADNDESPAIEVLNYRSPEGYFASMFITCTLVARH